MDNRPDNNAKHSKLLSLIRVRDDMRVDMNSSPHNWNVQKQQELETIMSLIADIRMELKDPEEVYSNKFSDIYDYLNPDEEDFNSYPDSEILGETPQENYKNMEPGEFEAPKIEENPYTHFLKTFETMKQGNKENLDRPKESYPEFFDRKLRELDVQRVLWIADFPTTWVWKQPKFEVFYKKTGNKFEVFPGEPPLYEYLSDAVKLAA